MLPPTRTSPSGFQARTMPSHLPLRGSDARMARLSRDTLTRYATFFLSWSACAKKPWPEAARRKRRRAARPQHPQNAGVAAYLIHYKPLACKVEPHSVGRKPAFRWPIRSHAFGMGSSVSASPAVDPKTHRSERAIELLRSPHRGLSMFKVVPGPLTYRR